MSMYSGLIRVMERAARKAGGRLRRDFGEVEHLQVSRKGPADFVSKADMRSERTLYDELLNARPDWGFVLRRRVRSRATRPSRAGSSIRSTAPATSFTEFRSLRSLLRSRSPSSMVRAGAK